MSKFFDSAKLLMEFGDDGVIHITDLVAPAQKRVDDIKDQIEENLRLTAHSMVIYKDDGSETKYWDVEMPVRGTGVQVLGHFKLKK